MEMKRMDSRKSIGSLRESIHSLLGLKTHLNSSWIDSVRNIIKSSPSDQQGCHCRDSKNYDIDTQDITILKIEDELAALTAHLGQLNIQRRQVLNDFLDLKGNIRVFCRTKPITTGENRCSLRPVVALDSSSLVLNFAENKSKIYSFDKVFHPGSSQDEVFEEVEPIIKAALDGYNACIFAYGQTGTGKTFTMEGTTNHPGIIPRALEALFKQAADSNHTFLFSFSMLEIYMGYPKDLLVPRTTKATGHMPPCLSIQTDSDGAVEIDNLVTIQVSDFNQAKRLYTLGRRFRSTASTNSNKSSSRSHCMVRLLMTCFDANERRRITNKIWMVDLGGSERVLKTKAWGRRFEEGKAINLSLSALGDVINALHRNNCHIPYRNSKLTQILKDSLGNDSKTLMLVHVSPEEEDLCETVCSLNFATRVRSIHLGNEESNEAKAQREDEMTSLQERMKWIEDKRQDVRREIQKFNEKLEDLRSSSSKQLEDKRQDVRREIQKFNAKLEDLRSSSSKQLEVSHLSFELGVPRSNIETEKKFGNVAAGLTSKLPRFMRPTVCSRRKSGVDCQKSAENDPKPAKKRRPTSNHAESVTLPTKGTSEYNSDSNISRNSYLVGSKFKFNSDNETDGSQDKSEYDIKTVVFPIQDKLPRPPNCKMADRIYNKTHRKTKTHYLNSSKFGRVDDWLHLNKHAYGTTSSTHQNKRVLALPHPEKIRRGNQQHRLEELHDDKVNDYKLSMNKIKHEEFKKLAEVGAAGSSRSEMVSDFMPAHFKRFSDDDSKSISTAATQSDGILMLEAHGMEDDFSVEENVCSTCTPPDQCVAIENKDDESGVNGIPRQLIKKETKFSEALKLNNSWTGIDSVIHVSGTTTAVIVDFGVPISRSELRAPCHRVLPETGKNCEEEKMHLSSHHSEAGKLQHQSLLLDKANQANLEMPIFHSQGGSTVAAAMAGQPSSVVET